MQTENVKHTPGPWHADTRESYLCGGDMVEITLHDENGMVCDQIASVMLDTGDDTPEDEKTYKQQEANARLIAAAPELLEALKVLIAPCSIDTCPQCEGSGKQFLSGDACPNCGGCGEIIVHEYWPQHVREARAIITKATGGAQ